MESWIIYTFSQFCKNLQIICKRFATTIFNELLVLASRSEMLKMARKIKQRKADKEKKTKVKHFRCTESREKQINESDFSIDEMLDMFFLFSADEQFEMLMKLREIRTELKFKKQALSDAKATVDKLEDAVLSLEIEMEQIQEKLDGENYNLKDYAKAKQIDNSIQTTLKYYREYYNPTNNPNLSIEEFINSKKTRTYVKKQATRCGLEFEDFVDQLVKAYNESEVQQVLI